MTPSMASFGSECRRAAIACGAPLSLGRSHCWRSRPRTARQSARYAARPRSAARHFARIEKVRRADAIGDAADCLLRGVVTLAARAPDDPARRVFAYRGAERPDEHAGELGTARSLQRGGTLVAAAQLSVTQRRCRASSLTKASGHRPFHEVVARLLFSGAAVQAVRRSGRH